MQRRQRQIVVALPALDLRYLDVALRILRLGRDEGVVSLQRIVQLVRVEQRIGQTAHRVCVVAFDVERALVRSSSFVGLVQLVIACTDGKFNAHGTIRHGECSKRRNDTLRVTLLTIEPGQIQQRLF